LGAATKVDKVEIHWPDGVIETVTLAGCDRAYTIIEGQGVAGRSRLVSAYCGRLMRRSSPL
jgi:hypothetical protein